MTKSAIEQQWDAWRDPILERLREFETIARAGHLVEATTRHSLERPGLHIRKIFEDTEGIFIFSIMIDTAHGKVVFPAGEGYGTAMGFHVALGEENIEWFSVKLGEEWSSQNQKVKDTELKLLPLVWPDLDNVLQALHLNRPIGNVSSWDKAIGLDVSHIYHNPVALIGQIERWRYWVAEHGSPSLQSAVRVVDGLFDAAIDPFAWQKALAFFWTTTPNTVYSVPELEAEQSPRMRMP